MTARLKPEALEPEALERGSPLGHGRLLVGCLVGVDDALAGGLVESAGGGAQPGLDNLTVAGVGCLAEAANGGLQRRPDGLVAKARLLVGADPLDLRLDVGHAATTPNESYEGSRTYLIVRRRDRLHVRRAPRLVQPCSRPAVTPWRRTPRQQERRVRRAGHRSSDDSQLLHHRAHR